MKKAFIGIVVLVFLFVFTACGENTESNSSSEASSSTVDISSEVIVEDKENTESDSLSESPSSTVDISSEVIVEDEENTESDSLSESPSSTVDISSEVIVEDKFSYGTFNNAIFKNQWLKLMYRPKSIMPAIDPEVIMNYNDVMGEYDQKCLMHFQAEESADMVQINAQKLNKNTTASKILTQSVRDIENALKEYSQLSFSYKDSGTYNLCGEIYEYQNYVISGGIHGTVERRLMIRILDGYAITINISEGVFSIEEHLNAFSKYF